MAKANNIITPEEAIAAGLADNRCKFCRSSGWIVVTRPHPISNRPMRKKAACECLKKACRRVGLRLVTRRLGIEKDAS
jgi:hypothetical protein